MCNVFGIVFVTVYHKPLVIVPTIAIGLFFVHLRTVYVQSSRAIKRLEGAARSPIFDKASTTVSGLRTIRAFGQEKRLTQEFDYQQVLFHLMKDSEQGTNENVFFAYYVIGSAFILLVYTFGSDTLVWG